MAKRSPQPDPPPPTPPPTAAPTWVFPDIQRGTEVECCKQVDFVNVMTGRVGRVSASHCEVMATHPLTGQDIPIPTCYHIDDPRLKSSPELNEVARDGFFRVSARETARLRMVQQFAAFDERSQAHEAEIAGLKKRLTVLEKIVADSGKQSPSGD